MFRILAIDDHDMVRDGIKSIFPEAAGVAVFGEARTRNDALRLVRDDDWDIAVLDISLGDSSGLELLKEIKQLRPRLPVLMLSLHAEELYAVRSFKAGAAGYVTKDTSRDELREAILKVLKGGRYVSRSLADKMAFDLSAPDGPRHESLSDRELEVLCLIASGRTVGEIARQLFLSDKTISTYRRRILDKMAMRTNAELTHYAIREKLVD